MKNEEIKFKPCPFCGSPDIGVKDNIVNLLPDDKPSKARRKIWAYCRHCGAECEKYTADVDDNTDEEIQIGADQWNKSFKLIKPT